MLSIDEQIAHLESKGVRFDLCDKDEASSYLAEKNNYYKVASYRKLFSVRQGGQNSGTYANLDFAYLKDLSAIDQLLRYSLLPMTLDVEHFAKIKLLTRISEAGAEDGYCIVSEYLASKEPSRRSRINVELEIMSKDPYCGDMVLKYRDDMPVWVFLEAVSFGTFMDFYKFCAERWGSSVLRDEHYLLKSVKSVRNAAAHSSNMINGFSDVGSVVRNYRPVSDALSAAGVSKAQRRVKMRNPFIQRIITTLFFYDRIVAGSTSRERTKRSLLELKGRMMAHEEYYRSNDAIRSSFAFLGKIIDEWF
ncbi:MAG: Abi family protein [Alistipes sp.]